MAFNKKNILISVLVVLGLLSVGGGYAYTQNLGAQPALSAFQGGTGTSSPSGILYGDQTIRVKTVTVGSGLSFAGGTLSSTGGGSGNVATSSTETSGQVPFWTSTGATPATLSGGESTFTYDATLNKLTVTNASTTDLSVANGATTTSLYIAGTIYGAGLQDCDATSDKLIWHQETNLFNCGGDNGLIETLRGEFSALQSGTDQTFATTSDTNLQLTITSAADVHTFTPVWAGTLADSRVNDALTISGGTINNTPIGASSPSTGIFTNATSTNATTTNFDISGGLTFNGVTATTWAAFCNTITGGAGLCDGDDAAGSGANSKWATSTDPQFIYPSGISSSVLIGTSSKPSWIPSDDEGYQLSIYATTTTQDATAYGGRGLFVGVNRDASGPSVLVYDLKNLENLFSVQVDGSITAADDVFGGCADATGLGLNISSVVFFDCAALDLFIDNGQFGVGTTTPAWPAQFARSSGSQLALSDGSETSAHWTFRNINSNLYVATSSPTTFATTTYETTYPPIAIANDGSIAFGTGTPPTNSLFTIGTSTQQLFHISTGGSVGILCKNNNSGRLSFGCGSNLNVNPNVFGLFQDPSDARFGASVSDSGVFMKSSGGVYAFNYATGLPKDLTLQEFSPGEVGITDTTPDFKFEVQTASSNGYFGITNSTDGDVLTVNNVGNFGIGTTTPKWALQVASSTGPQLALSDGSLGSLHWTLRNKNGVLYFATSSPSTFATSSPAAITVDGNSGSSGLYVGTSTPGATGLAVVGTSFMHSLTQATGGTNNDLCISGTANELIEETTGTCIVSSRKFKHDIETLTVNALDVISSLRTASFVMNGDESNLMKMGFIAEEAFDALPELALKGSNGEVRSLDDHAFLAVLWKGIQELIAKVTGLETRMEMQDTKIKMLEERLNKLEHESR